MPRPKKDSSAQLAIPQSSVTVYGSGPHPDNPRLTMDGEAHPQWTWRNLSDYGFLCPRREYIESPNPPELKALALRWNVGDRDILKWKEAKKWDDSRAREWQSASIEDWKKEAGTLQVIQKKEIAGQAFRWSKLRQMTEELLAKGTVPEQTATGVIYDREFSLKEIKDAASILALCDEQMARTIGMSKARIKDIVAQEDSSSGEIVIQRVKKVRHNFTVEVEEEPVSEQRNYPELPEIGDDHVIEAEIVE